MSSTHANTILGVLGTTGEELGVGGAATLGVRNRAHPCSAADGGAGVGGTAGGERCAALGAHHTPLGGGPAANASSSSLREAAEHCYPKEGRRAEEEAEGLELMDITGRKQELIQPATAVKSREKSAR